MRFRYIGSLSFTVSHAHQDNFFSLFHVLHTYMRSTLHATWTFSLSIFNCELNADMQRSTTYRLPSHSHAHKYPSFRCDTDSRWNGFCMNCRIRAVPLLLCMYALLSVFMLLYNIIQCECKPLSVHCVNVYDFLLSVVHKNSCIHIVVNFFSLYTYMHIHCTQAKK